MAHIKEYINKYWVYAVVIIIGLIVGFTGGALWKGRSLSTKVSSSTSDTVGILTTGKNSATSSDFLSAADKTDTLSVPDQSAGDTVVLGAVSVSSPSWIAITEDSNGKPSRILGAGLFFPNMLTGTVELLRATIPGNTYHALIYVDDGDREFDYRVDSPLTLTNGNPAETIFKTF